MLSIYFHENNHEKIGYEQSSNFVRIISLQNIFLFLGIGELDIRNANAHNIRKVTTDLVSTDGMLLILLSVNILNLEIMNENIFIYLSYYLYNLKFYTVFYPFIHTFSYNFFTLQNPFFNIKIEHLFTLYQKYIKYMDHFKNCKRSNLNWFVNPLNMLFRTTLL